jgi:hypothetical protein
MIVSKRIPVVIIVMKKDSTQTSYAFSTRKPPKTTLEIAMILMQETINGTEERSLTFFSQAVGANSGFSSPCVMT